MRTGTAARASGYSIEQMRVLEREGVIPPAARLQNGYRDYAAIHVTTARAYRRLAAAVGPVQARSVLRQLWAEPPDEVIAMLNAFHVELHRQRREALEARHALRVIGSEPMRYGADPGEDSLTISELADAVGVRASALRFWEQCGLVRPDRVTSRAARLYPPEAVRDARITAALRAAGYRIPDVRRAIERLRDQESVEHSIEALDVRLAAIAARTIDLLQAGNDLASLLLASQRGGSEGT